MSEPKRDMSDYFQWDEAGLNLRMVRVPEEPFTTLEFLRFLVKTGTEHVPIVAGDG